MPDNYDNIPNNVDDYTALVEAECNMEACTGGDALKNFEDECLRFSVFSINRNDDNVFDFHDDIFTPPPNESKPVPITLLTMSLGMFTSRIGTKSSFAPLSTNKHIFSSPEIITVSFDLIFVCP